MITKEKAEEIVRDLLTKSQERLKQELVGENDELLDRVVRQYRAKAARHSWKASQKWCKWDAEGPVLMPDFTRIYYRKGQTEVLLQEFPPQIRLMKFKGSLDRNSSGDALPLNSEDILHYSLALPYVVFLFKFVNGMFSVARCVFSDRPLKRLEERPLRPYLSNIDSNLTVCFGHDLDRSQLLKDQLAQQVAYLLDHFWHSAYSEDWSSHFWTIKGHFLAKDERLATLSNWQAASQDNPLFVVEGVDWLKHTEESFGDMIVRLFEDDITNHNLQEEMYNELVSTFLEEVKKTVSESFSSVSERTLEKEVERSTNELLTKLGG